MDENYRISLINAFQDAMINEKRLFSLINAIEEGKIELLFDLAGEVGGKASEILLDVSKNFLEDGKLSDELAEKLIQTILEQSYEKVSSVTADAYGQVFSKSGLQIKGQKAPLNQDRIDGLITVAQSGEENAFVNAVSRAKIENFCRNIVADSAAKNAKFATKAGLKAKIIRKSSGHCCKWCSSLAGEYTYPDVPRDVYRMHENCDCTVVFDPADGTNRYQDVWSKTWSDEIPEAGKANREERNLRRAKKLEAAEAKAEKKKEDQKIYKQRKRERISSTSEGDKWKAKRSAAYVKKKTDFSAGYLRQKEAMKRNAKYFKKD